MKKIETTTWKVHAFVDKNGHPTTVRKDQTVMLGSGLRGDMKGACSPFGMNIARKLCLKVGDHFVEQTHYFRA